MIPTIRVSLVQSVSLLPGESVLVLIEVQGHFKRGAVAVREGQ